MISHYYLIKQGSKVIGLRHSELSYVVGFRSPMQARHVQYNMHPEKDLMMRRGEPMDVSPDVRQGLVTLGAPRDTIQSIYLDVMAKLVIAKNDATSEFMRDGSFHLATIKSEDLMCMPFTNYIGIILPTDIINEDDDNIEFACDVIDPFYDQKMYASTLKL